MGACADDCAGAVCPSGQGCTKGTCVDLPDAGAGDAGGLHNPDGDGGTGTGADASLGDAATDGSTGDDAGLPPLGVSKAACACSSVGGGGGGDAMLASAVAALALARLRRRKR
jgi:MYXO-CTERM domain-containing protein